MKKIFVLIFTFLMMPGLFSICSAEIDPILVDKPDPSVFECNENIFIEIPGNGFILYTRGKIHAEKYFLMVKAEVLYLEDSIWDGIDKNSFQLKHNDSEGNEEIFPLNYMMTTRENLIKDWPTFSEPLIFGWLLPTNLIFDVTIPDGKGWSLIFRPSERGGEPICEIEIPLDVRGLEARL